VNSAERTGNGTELAPYALFLIHTDASVQIMPDSIHGTDFEAGSAFAMMARQGRNYIATFEQSQTGLVLQAGFLMASATGGSAGSTCNAPARFYGDKSIHSSPLSHTRAVVEAL
jgi:hypothetical protein